MSKTTILSMTILLCVFFAFGSAQANESAQLKKKFFPGHYLTTTLQDGYGMAPLGSVADRNTRQLVSANPNFRGYHNKYRWADLEPARGAYDFSKIIEDLSIAAADGKVMSFMIVDRRNESRQPFPLPSYMNRASADFDLAYKDAYFIPTSKPGAISPNWTSEILTDRMIDLVTALGAALDSHPTLASVGLPETAMIELKDQPWYDPNKHLEYYNRVHNAAARAFPTTIFNQMVNWRSGLSEEMADQMVERMVNTHSMSFGATDIIATHAVRGGVARALDSQFGKYYGLYRGTAIITIEAQAPTYNYGNARTQFDYAIEDAGAHTVLWLAMIKRYDDVELAFTINDVIDVVNAEGGRTNPIIPRSLILENPKPGIPAPVNLKLSIE